MSTRVRWGPRGVPPAALLEEEPSQLATQISTSGAGEAAAALRELFADAMDELARAKQVFECGKWRV